MAAEVQRICVVGAGNMGHQIALHGAISGFDVVCSDVSGEVMKQAETFAEQYLAERVVKGKLSDAEASQAQARLRFESDLQAACHDVDYAIEAVPEVLALKREIFAELDRHCPPHAILGTNSSAIVSSLIADATQRPDKVLNLHFFNPVLVMKLVEIVQGPHTSDETVDVSRALCERMNKVTVHLKKEVHGFLLSRILSAIAREAFWLLEMGVASVEDIDKACVYGAGHPMGPFKLNDLTGIDLGYIMSMERFRETGDLKDLPPPSLVEHYVKGEYGQKTGKGWYNWSTE